MAGRPRNEVQRQAQRERILAAAEALLVSHGVERSRLRDVAEAAGVSVGTVPSRSSVSRDASAR